MYIFKTTILSIKRLLNQSRIFSDIANINVSEVLNQEIFRFEEADYFNAAMKNLFQKGKSF